MPLHSIGAGQGLAQRQGGQVRPKLGQRRRINPRRGPGGQPRHQFGKPLPAQLFQVPFHPGEWRDLSRQMLLGPVLLWIFTEPSLDQLRTTSAYIRVIVAAHRQQ